MYALIDKDNLVVSVDKNKFPVHTNYTWKVCSSEVKIHYKYNPDNKTYYDPEDIPKPYQFERATRFPPIGEQLDAILKQFKAMEIVDSESVQPELSEIIDKWEAVKAAYPKPTV